MPFNNVGFFTKRRGLGGAGGVAPSPTRSLTITPTLSNNGERVTWTITSNMTSGVTLDYQFTGANSTTFVESTTSGNIVLNSNGSATIVRNLDKFNDYANTSNLAVNINFYAPGSAVFLGKSNSNVIVGPANTFAATGGNITSFTGGVDNLQGEYTLHTFNYTGSLANLVVTNVGDYPANTQISVVVVGGGGAGGSQTWWTNSPANLSVQDIADDVMGSYQGYAAGGGAGGNVVLSNLTAQNFNLSNYPVYVGAGGTISAFKVSNPGQTSWFAASSNIIASGGSAGSYPSGDLNTPTLGTGNGGSLGSFVGGNSAIRTYNNFSNTFTWVERTGGGGAGATQRGGNATISTGTNGVTANDGYGGVGGAGRSFTITGNLITAGGGGGGGSINFSAGPALGGSGGGGNGGYKGVIGFTTGNIPAGGGLDGLGGGGGGAGGGFYSVQGLTYKEAINYYIGGGLFTGEGADGGNGIVYIRYPSKYRRLRIES